MGLSQLSNEDLIRYHKSYKDMMQRPRDEAIKRFSMDTKFAYHVVRLLSEVEQIMTEHDLDLERNREQLKAIRRGEWTLEYLQEWFQDREKALGEVYDKSDLRYGPDEAGLRDLLLECLEEHYGSITQAIGKTTTTDAIINDLQALLAKYQ